jgi:hypothetical protein
VPHLYQPIYTHYPILPLPIFRQSLSTRLRYVRTLLGYVLGGGLSAGPAGSALITDPVSPGIMDIVVGFMISLMQNLITCVISCERNQIREFITYEPNVCGVEAIKRAIRLESHARAAEGDPHVT